MTKTTSLVPSASSEAEICTFNDGLAKIRARLMGILEGQDNVVFGISGTAVQRHKDFLANAVSVDFMKEGIPAAVCHQSDDLEKAAQQIRLFRERFETDKGLYILKAWDPPHGLKTYRNKGIRKIYDEALAERAKKLNLPLKKVDVWVAVYSSAKSSIDERVGRDYDPFEDFIIV